MIRTDPLDLPWLPNVPPDFRDQVRAVRKQQPVDVTALRRLATTALDLSQLTLLARACQEAAAQRPGQTVRLRVLCNSTADLILSALSATAPRHGLLIAADAGPYGSWMQEAIDADSHTRRHMPDVVLLALDHHAFFLKPSPGNAETATQRVAQARQQLSAATRALQSHGAAWVIVQTLVEPPTTLFGHLDAQVPGTHRWMIERFNQALRSDITPGVLLLDAAQLAARVGADRWTDPTLWNMGKVPLSARATPLYADHVCRLVMAARGLAKKCLVLDLDKTLWGGVIGDDGMAGIVLGQGSPLGEAHLSVQAAALALRERGVVLAVSSKNDEAIARQPFLEHPEMLLREQHIAVFQANWQDKASNLRAIAAALNIGVDALVLLDDNPSERHQVRAELPEVGVPELPEGAEHYAQLLLAAGYFESVQFTPEDLARADQYQANAQRDAMLGAATDLSAHLKSLMMVADCSPFDAVGRARIAQLINKTNQFNLTTRRRTDAEVMALESDPTALTLQIRLKDRFGDNGMISVVICLRQADDWIIDTWLMSCRVLNRQVERAVLNTLMDQARRAGIRQLVGSHLPTAKNGMVAGHYPTLGFQPIASDTESDAESDAESAAGLPSRGTTWVLAVDTYCALETAIQVNISAPALALPMSAGNPAVMPIPH